MSSFMHVLNNILTSFSILNMMHKYNIYNAFICMRIRHVDVGIVMHALISAMANVIEVINRFQNYFAFCSVSSTMQNKMCLPHAYCIIFEALGIFRSVLFYFVLFGHFLKVIYQTLTAKTKNYKKELLREVQEFDDTIEMKEGSHLFSTVLYCTVLFTIILIIFTQASSEGNELWQYRF